MAPRDWNSCPAASADGSALATRNAPAGTGAAVVADFLGSVLRLDGFGRGVVYLRLVDGAAPTEAALGWGRQSLNPSEISLNICLINNFFKSP